MRGHFAAILCATLLWCGGTLLGAPAAAKAARPWHLTPPERIDPPTVKGADWARNDIDRFVLKRLEEASLLPAPEASKRDLVRRLYFDLIGLPPTPEEVDAFVESEDAKAYDALVDKLLDDSRYGERWARFWLDLARYADTAGYEGDPDLPNAWRYRDYVIDAFNSDKPYDQFVREQLAGDELKQIMGAGSLPVPKPEYVVAMTFLRLAPFTEPRGDETRHEMLSEMTSTVGSVFLGLTIGCAKCHDHKYDAIPTKDFYRMKAFFDTIQITPPEHGDIYQIGGPQPAEFYRPGESEWAEKKRTEYEGELEGAKKALDAYVARLQRKLTEVRGAADPVSVDDVKKAIRDETDSALSAEERELYRELDNQPHLIRQRIKRLQPVALSLRHSFGPPYEPGVPTSYVMVRGEFNHLGEVVRPGFLSAITGNQTPAKIPIDPFQRWPTRGRRKVLADWITRPDHPLTARVMVNRLWHHHFGRGIVATPSDFGELGAPPTHPDLLDWLAREFVDAQWSIKSMHRLMVNSSTYRQTSRHVNERAEQELDPENKLLWRFPRQRLEAEAIRDAILTVSGRLNPEQFGLPIFPPLPGNLDEEVKYSRSKWDTTTGAEARRRSIYIYQQRTLNMPFLDSFDALVCDTSRSTRRVSVTALQSLELYNGELANTEARHFAARVRKETGDEVREQITHAFRLALGRTPGDDEMAHCLDLVQESSAPDDGLVAVCRVLFNLNEFVYID